MRLVPSVLLMTTEARCNSIVTCYFPPELISGQLQLFYQARASKMEMIARDMQEKMENELEEMHNEYASHREEAAEENDMMQRHIRRLETVVTEMRSVLSTGTDEPDADSTENSPSWERMSHRSSETLLTDTQ